MQAIRSSRFVKRDRVLDSEWEIILWWEARRIPFNVLVGVTGIVTSLGILAIALIADEYFHAGEEAMLLPDPPIVVVLAVVGYGIVANVCYTGGWIAELIVRRTWPEDSGEIGTLSFTLGLVLSVGVTLLPLPIYVALVVLFGFFLPI